MAAWFVDRALPGIFSGGLMAIAVAVSHLLLRRHVTRTADRQTATLTGSAPAETSTEEEATMTEATPHPAVDHPVRLRLRADLARYELGFRGKIAAGNDWLATHLAVVFGVCWTIWVFFIVPVVAYFLPAAIQNKIFFFSSGWIQLFALPLMVYVGNKLQRSSDAQSEVMHQALTHIATVSDQNKQLLDQNTTLTKEVHRLVSLTAPEAAPAVEPVDGAREAEDVVPAAAAAPLSPEGGAS